MRRGGICEATGIHRPASAVKGVLDFISDIANIKLRATRAFRRPCRVRSVTVAFDRLFGPQTHVKYEGFCVLTLFRPKSRSEIAVENATPK